jgi:outer membrane protein TolC
MKSIAPIFTGLFVASSLLCVQATQLLDEPFLGALRSEAARHHPAASAGALRSAAAIRDVRGVRLWDDPMVGLSLMGAAAEKRRSDGDVRVSFEQPLPKPGLFAATRSKAEALQRAELENSRFSTLEVSATAARDAIELALADESIALQCAQLKWLESMTENARQRAANPDATGIDALRLESELARETQILEAARRTRESLASSLNLRLGRPLESPWPSLNLGSASYSVPLANSEIARISHANPKVRSLREMASAASAETRIADRERLPQLTVGVDVDTYSGSDFRSASLGLKMSLPYVNRSSDSAKIAASLLREKAALQDIETTRLEVTSAVLAAVAESKNAAAQARAYSGEVYQRALSASLAVEGSWISSKSSVADLLDAQRQLFSIRLEQRRFVAMQRVALEELNKLVPKLKQNSP